MDAHLEALLDSEASAWLAPPPELVSSSRSSSQGFYDLIVKYAPPGPLPTLLVDGFDAEQIWQQIDLKSRPVLNSVRRQLKSLNKLPEDGDPLGSGQMQEDAQIGHPETVDAEEGHLAETDEDAQNGHLGDFPSDDSEEEDVDNFGDEDDGESEDDTMRPVEDEFLKLKDMERFLDGAEAQERGEGGEDDEDEDENEDPSSGEQELIRYDDFFKKKKKTKPLKLEAASMDEEGLNDEDEEGSNDEDEVEDGADDDENDEDDEEEADEDRKVVESKSTHEKQVEKIQKRIKQLEKANLDPQDWTMRGEITANKRPKNSALEVELNFDHNVRPVPVITEEENASIEDMIKRRIIEGRFDDPVRKQRLPDAPPAEKMEIDETKSKKGLGELYEADYMQSAGLAAAPTTETDTIKKEVTTLFKSLCAKLDALSHYHFAPRPVIEDMEVRPVPALAMEEVAPVHVSEAAMVAPEEIFHGTGAIKDEKELTPSERKQRRAAKKRKRNAQRKENEHQKKARVDEKAAEDKLPVQPKKGTSEFSKSSKVFAALDRAKNEPVSSKAHVNVEKSVKASSLKL